MGTLHKVAVAGEVPVGGMKKMSVAGKDILLANVNGAFFAIDARCPHLGGDLSQGRLEGTVVTCPRHGTQFDVVDGHIVRWLKGPGLLTKMSNAVRGPREVVSYPVRQDGEDIGVELP